MLLLREASGLAMQAMSKRGCCASVAKCLSSLVIVEHRGGKLAASTHNTIAAAARLSAVDGSSTGATALVAGESVDEVAQQAAALPGVDRVLVADAPMLQHQLAEPSAQLLAALVRDLPSISHVLAPATTFGKNLLPRAAALLDVQPVADIVEVVDPHTFVRPIYAGNAMATVRVSQQQQLVMGTVRPTAFARLEGERSGGPAAVERVQQAALEAATVPDNAALTVWVGSQEAKAERPDLSSARVVVAGGRALKSAEGFKQLEVIADLLGGAVGASRAAVDAGYVPNDLQVGQTGKVVAPQLYIAVGISGAIQHVAGMKDSRVIVAINSDAEAPIFQLADYGLVGDLFTLLPELEAALRQLKGQSTAAAA